MRRQRRGPGSKLLALSSIITLLLSSAFLVAAPALAEDGAALNIRKVDEEGNRLAGAVFTVEGMEGTFTTGENGHFCITGLPNDSVWLVTEIEAPEGFEIADEPSQMVEVDDDGDCNSPDAVFVNTLAESVQPTPTPGGDEEPNPTPTPRGDVAGGNPTPSGATSGTGGLPNTAADDTAAPWLAGLLALLAIGSLGALVFVRVAEARIRR